MTRLEELLERAAEPQPLGFDSATIGARVRTLPRAARSWRSPVSRFVLGVTAVAVTRDDRQTVTYGSPEGAPLVGRWTAVEFGNRDAAERRDEQLARIDAEIERQREIDAAEDRTGRSRPMCSTLIQKRANLLTANDPWSGVYLDLRDDGTLGGFDGCNDFSGHWAVEGDRLAVTQLIGEQNLRPTGADTGSR